MSGPPRPVRCRVRAAGIRHQRRSARCSPNQLQPRGRQRTPLADTPVHPVPPDAHLTVRADAIVQAISRPCDSKQGKFTRATTHPDEHRRGARRSAANSPTRVKVAIGSAQDIDARRAHGARPRRLPPPHKLHRLQWVKVARPAHQGQSNVSQQTSPGGTRCC